MLEVSGIVSVPRKARRVLVPMDIFASKVSAPPKTLRIRAEAVYNRVRSWWKKKKERVQTALPSLFPNSVVLDI